jgi:hypothetical protein
VDNVDGLRMYSATRMCTHWWPHASTTSESNDMKSRGSSAASLTRKLSVGCVAVDVLAVDDIKITTAIDNIL